MNNENYFHSGPALRFSRNRFNMPFQHSTAYNAGDIVPLMTDYIYPGDSWRTKLSFLTRMFTPIAPVMSNMYQDFYAFFVPWRIVWEHTKQFFGENEVGAWTAALDRIIPQHPIDIASIQSGTASQFPEGAGVGHTAGTPGWKDDNGNLPPGSIGDYMGIVCPEFQRAAEGNSLSDLFRRAYLQVYNDWFRDENIIAPVLFSKGDTQAVGEAVFYWSPCLKAAKFHDYFTSLLPEAMKGPVPTIGDMMPVVPGTEHITSDDVSSPMSLRTVRTDGAIDNFTLSHALGEVPISGGAGRATWFNDSVSESGFYPGGVVPSNLWAKVNITIEDIRKASVITHIFEKLAVCGSRYPEFLQGMWGVISPDASLQVSEYLGGVRFPIKIQEVLSNSDTLSADQSSGQPIGQTGAMSKTGQSGALFNKSFTEYGILLCVGVLRVEQTYFQGVARKFLNKSFFDFYLPAAANIGNQPVYAEELYARDRAVTDKGLGKVVLGYSEAYAYLRYLPWRLSSIMKPNAENGLSWWTATDVLDEPILDQSFIVQGTTGLDRVIAIGSANRGSFQFFGDFRFDNDVTRILPDHSRPGLTRI
jgi:hypothetical protein